MLVAYLNSCFIIIRQTSFLFLFLAESAKISVQPFSIGRHFFPQQHPSHMHSKRSPKDILIGVYIIVQTGIYV
jgi:hypothetical protein